jgi:hypothetical protein
LQLQIIRAKSNPKAHVNNPSKISSNGRLPNSSSSGSLGNEPIANQSSLFNNNNNNSARSQNFSKSKAALEGLFGGTTAPSSLNSSNSNIGASIQQSQPQPPPPVLPVSKPNYNKPNLAPKPPGQAPGNLGPPVSGNQVTRHQSMRTPK